MHLIQEIGSYAGFAAVVGIAVLSALYFSQARDVKRLREWAGRAPERAAEAEAGGRQPAVGASRAPARATPAPASPAAAAPTAKAAQPAAKEPAQPAPAAQPAAPAASPVPAASPAAKAPAVAGAAAAGVATATPGTGTAPVQPARTDEGENGTGNSGAATGAKVLPPRPTPAPRPNFTRPTEVSSRSVGNTAVMSAPLADGRDRRLPPPRYLALIVAGLIVLGIAAALGVIALTDSGTSSSTQSASSGQQAGVKHHKKKKKNFPPAIDPSTVTVAVLNGTSVPGLAAKAGGKIQAAGFKLGNVTNAAQAGQRTESVAMFKPGENRKARAVARKLGISQIEPIDAQTSTLAGAASVVVVVGADQISR